jgi:hypothetical protein
MVHAWYFTWLMPFTVATRNRGSILLTASGFVYFTVYNRTATEGWFFPPWEIVLLWVPFILGFLWSYQGQWTECWPARKEVTVSV